ncbi:UNVERIFIED_CONTAM: hypothetical protein Slati_1714600 [Sesamum latifolium]|uniref:Uncharacterized protein n=1 Tax=Sesamum latifolium TaxID=2727402 RepID=A0AAW2WVR9_9LAMI
MEFDVGSHPGLDVYALILEIASRQIARHRNLFSNSTNDCGHRFIEREYISKCMEIPLSHLDKGRIIFLKLTSSLHTPTTLDKAYDDHVWDTITSRTDPIYSHHMHVTAVIPQV